MERRVWRCKQLFESWPQKPSGRYSCEALRWTANFRIDRADADVQQAWRCPVESNMKQLKPNFCKVSHSGIAIRWERINEAKCIPSWEFAPHIGILGSLRYISSGSLSQHSTRDTQQTHSGIHKTRPCRGLGRDAIDACGQEVVPPAMVFQIQLIKPWFETSPPQLPRCHLHGPAPACMALIAYQLIPNLPNPVNLPQGSRHIHHSQVQLPDLHMKRHPMSPMSGPKEPRTSYDKLCWIYKEPWYEINWTHISRKPAEFEKLRKPTSGWSGILILHCTQGSNDLCKASHFKHCHDWNVEINIDKHQFHSISTSTWQNCPWLFLTSSFF